MAIIGFSGLTFAEVVIIDNGDIGTNPEGTWLTSSGANPYGSESLYAPTWEPPGAWYEWRYDVSDPNEDVDIDIWWTWFSNRCNKVGYGVSIWYQGVEVDDYTSGLLDQTDINAAGRWNDLTTISYQDFSPGSYIIVRIWHNEYCESNDKTTCADAVRFSNPPGVGGGDCDQIKTELEQLKNDLQAIINSIP